VCAARSEEAQQDLACALRRMRYCFAMRRPNTGPPMRRIEFTPVLPNDGPSGTDDRPSRAGRPTVPGTDSGFLSLKSPAAVPAIS